MRRLKGSIKKVVKTFRLLVILIIPLYSLLLSNCRKEQFGSGSLSFSTDTLTFDTVFTSLGSTTRYFKVFNRDKKAVRISDIRLMHLNASTEFRIRVDGITGDHVTNVEIPAKDSIYVFVEVTVNPNSSATPFVIIDDVVFMNNETENVVHLQAFGQNAHFHYGEEIKTGIVNWNNDLPHVIISHDTVPGVFVDCGATLNINAGCKIFFAGNSAIFVQGTLNALASSWNDSISFEGARLENFYDNKPGQWFGIVFLRDSAAGGCIPRGNFDHCSINESSYGIYAGAGLSNNLASYQSPSPRPEVVIKNTVIKNSQSNALYGFNAKITAENSIFFVSGDNLLKFGLGGEYSFTHCTMFNNGSRFISHSKEILLLSNFVADGNNTVYPEPLKTTFTNCVLDGSLQNEISFNNITDTLSSAFDISFSYCDVKSKQDTFEMFTLLHDHILFNEDPLFKKPEDGDFTPSDSNGIVSPLIDYCLSGLPLDIFGQTRMKINVPNPNIYDAGAVEAQ